MLQLKEKFQLKESKLYAKFAEEFCSVKEITISSIKDCFDKEFVKTLRVEESFELYGQEIHIVVLPRGLRLIEFQFGGGGMAQPWFLKNDVSRVFVHQELLDFVEANPKIKDSIYKELINHEVGHLVSLSNYFKDEFDTMESSFIDRREFENLKKYIDSEGIRNLEIDGESFDTIIKCCDEDLNANFRFYYDLRENVANYYAAQCLKKEGKKKSVFFTVMQETAGLLAKLLIQGMDENSAFSLGILKNTLDDETLELLELSTLEIMKPRCETYQSWINR